MFSLTLFFDGEASREIAAFSAFILVSWLFLLNGFLLIFIPSCITADYAIMWNKRLAGIVLMLVGIFTLSVLTGWLFDPTFLEAVKTKWH